MRKTATAVIFIYCAQSLSLMTNITAGEIRNKRVDRDVLAELYNPIETDPVSALKAVQDSMREYNQRQWKHPRRKRAVKRVCYRELGCFEDSGPFGYLEMLPSPPEEINTKFYFYSTKNRSDRPLMELPFLNMTEAFSKKKRRKKDNSDELATPTMAMNGTTSEITSSTTTTTTTTVPPTVAKSFTKTPFTMDSLKGFDELSVRVIVHGFGSACPHVWIYEMKTALMAVEDCIVICVDWEKGATFPNYVRAATNTRLVGKQLALLINNLREHKGLNLTRTHLIGFSLGAHVSGFAGAELPGLSRITGLDPAGPLFEAQHPKVRLDSTDAKFVDVIHSNGENLILGGLGSWQAMGDVDFYPNGGRVQTGCSNLFVGAVTDFIWSQTAEEEEGRSLCNHRRAYKFFIDSVARRCLFPAFPCDNYDNFLKGKCFPCARDNETAAADGEYGASRCGNMGYYADRSTGRGQLYLVTRDEEPFCAHQFLLEIFNSFNDLPLRTIGRLEAVLEGEGGLNETFKISEKEDTEFFAGDIVSKIIVPHPALGFPTSLSLQYKSYSGWLSKGLPHWDIDKVVLTDSFGRSHSICKPSTKLLSGSLVQMKLVPFNCDLPNQEDYGTLTTEASSERATADDQDRIDVDSEVMESVKHRQSVFDLNPKFNSLIANSTYELRGDSSEEPWQPILEGNSLDRDGAAESSRSLSSEPAEIFEPVLKRRRLTVDKGRNLHETPDEREEIREPVLKATTPRQKKSKEISKRVTTTTTNATPLYMQQQTQHQQHTTEIIQLFPLRLSEFLQRAERYARETLLPLISVQAPKFFGFNVPATAPQADEKKEEPRKPRYIPRFEEQAFLQSVTKTATAQQPHPAIAARKHDVFGRHNIFEAVRMQNAKSPPPSSSSTANQRRGFNEVIYYTNELPNDAATSVYIDLPTYRPSKTLP